MVASARSTSGLGPILNDPARSGAGAMGRWDGVAALQDPSSPGVLYPVCIPQTEIRYNSRVPPEAEVTGQSCRAYWSKARPRKAFQPIDLVTEPATVAGLFESLKNGGKKVITPLEPTAEVVER